MYVFVIKTKAKFSEYWTITFVCCVLLYFVLFKYLFKIIPVFFL